MLEYKEGEWIGADGLLLSSYRCCGFGMLIVVVFGVVEEGIVVCVLLVVIGCLKKWVGCECKRVWKGGLLMDGWMC